MTNNFIYEYYQKITDGTITAGKWIRNLYALIVKGIEDRTFTFSAKKANAAIAFIEHFCRHHEGEKARELLKLELWQKAFLSCLFGILDENGNRQFRECVFIVARKNGKSILAAAIANYCTFLDGEYGGRIYFAAPKLEQANLCFEAYHQMILQEPELDQMAQKRRTDIYVKEWNATAKPLAFSAKKSDGLNVSLGVADEIASWAGDAGLKFYEVLKSSMGARRNPILLAMSSAGYENDGIFDELLKRSTRFLTGDSRENRLLPVLYIIDDVTKWNDINELQKSNPNLGVSVSVDYLLEEIAIAEGSLSKKAEFLTKYCNVKQSSSMAWLDVQTVERATGEHLELEQFRDSYAVAGVDLSRTTDLTACCVVIQKNGKLNVIAKFFLPAEKIDEATERDNVPYQAYIERGILQASGDNFVDYRDCFRWFADLVELYQIYPLKIGYDRYSAQYLIQDLKTYGHQVDDVFQGENLWPVILEMEGLLKDGTINIGDNDLLKAHLLNCALKMNNQRGRGRVEKINATQHIDGAAALLDALTVRQKWYGEIGEQLRNE